MKERFIVKIGDIMRKYRRSKKYYRYRKYAFITIFVLAFLYVSIKIIKYISIDKDYVLKINNEYIYKDEFLLYLYEQEDIFEEIGGVDIWETDFDGVAARNVDKNNAINSISILKAAVYQSENLGIYITEEDENTYKKEAVYLQESIKKEKNIEIPLDICEKFEKEKIIEQKVYDYITSSFVVDDKDFEKYFNDYIDKNEDKIKNINLDYIFIKNNESFDAKERANNIAKEVSFETDFDKFKEDPNIEVYKNIDLKNGIFEPNIEEKIYKLSEKSVSNAIEGIDGFYIFKINEILNANIEEIENIVKEEYIKGKKAEIYTNETKNWLNNIKIEKNNEILANI